MLIRIAKRAQARAERTGKLRHIRRAWFWRSLAQWSRGGDWTPFPKDEVRDRARRQSEPRRFTVIEMGGA